MLKPWACRRLGDVGRRDGAVQVALLVGAAFERDLDAGERLDERGLLLAALALDLLDLLASLLDLLDVVRRRLDGQVVREQVVPGVARRHLDDVADAADVLDRFLQEEFDGFDMDRSSVSSC